MNKNREVILHLTEIKQQKYQGRQFKENNQILNDL